MSDEEKKVAGLSPAERIAADMKANAEGIRGPTLKEIQSEKAVYGPDDQENPTVLILTIPIKKWSDDPEDGEALVLGHTRLFRQFAVNYMLMLRQKKNQNGLIQPKGDIRSKLKKIFH